MKVSFRHFYSIYRKLNVNCGSGKLRYCCKYKGYCWRPNNDERLSVVRRQGYITYPYIGKDYSTGGMVVIAINHRDNHGKYNNDQGSIITRKDHRYICGEINKHDGNKNNDKVFYFYRRIAKYVEALRLGNVIGDNDKWDSYKGILHKIALVQAIKCNPRGSKRTQERPTTEMWNNCPQFILSEELELLKPRDILILGKTNHLKILQSFAQLGYEQSGKPTKESSVWHYSYFKKPNKKINIYVANHPSRPGKSIQSICWELKELRKKYSK